MRAGEQGGAALARLTANEKECLRRRLLPQTAKEMATDLGISPHAVEKRLKMARAKLGVSSSLAAARLLAGAEQDQSLVPHIPDLPVDTSQSQSSDVAGSLASVKARRSLPKGLTMIAAICLIALIGQDAPPLPTAPAPTSSSTTNENLQNIPTRKVGMNEAANFIRGGFRSKDIDSSGYLDARETSSMEPRDAGRDKSLSPAPPAGAPDPAAERKWMAKLDTDRDGRVSEDEYVGYMIPWILWQGVPANWKPIS
jgi:DNA-binding CsgD family transcriptional regulator